MTCLGRLPFRSWFIPLALVVLICGATARLQAQGAAADYDVFLVATFDNNQNSFNYSQPIYIVNPGTQGGGTRCANIYVFDASYELLECCSCTVPMDGLLTLNVRDLTSKPITSVIPTVGAIKIVSTNPGESACSPTNQLNTDATLRAWMTHIQIVTTFPAVLLAKGTPTPILSVVPFDQSPLGPDEKILLPQACIFASIGSKGRCTCPQSSTPTD